MPSISIIRDTPKNEKVPEKKGKREATDTGTAFLVIMAIFSLILFCIDIYDLETVNIKLSEVATQLPYDYDDGIYNNVLSFASSAVHFFNGKSDRSNQDDNAVIQQLIIRFFMPLLFLGAFAFRFITFFRRICYKMALSKASYMEHFVMTNAPRAVIAISTFIWIPIAINLYKSEWNGLCMQTCKILIFPLSTIEVCFGIMMILITFTKIVKTEKNFDIMIRFYIGCSKIMLLQSLTLAVMIILILCAFGTMNRWLLWSLTLLPLMHTFIKMVIILATVSHNWDEDEDRDERNVSLKTIFSSMYTILRYHLGSAVVYTYLVWLPYYVETNDYDDLIMFDNEKSQRPIPIKSMKEYMIMLTAAHGQGAIKAKLGVQYFNNLNDGRLLGYKSKFSIICTDTRRILDCLLVFLIYAFVKQVKTGEELLFAVLIIMIYLIFNATYFYTWIYPLETVERTIRFCHMIKQEDLAIIDERFKIVSNKEKRLP